MLRAGLILAIPAAFAAGYLGVRSIDSSAQPPEAPDLRESTAAIVEPVRPKPIETVSVPLAPSVRNVTPSGFTLPPPVETPPVRVAAEPKPEPPPKPREERFHKPIFAAAGIIETGTGPLRLGGVAAPEADETCGEAGAEWPCGRMALAAMQRFVRGRAIDCPILPGAETARCSVGGKDIGEWLVAQGWAKADGPDYSEAERIARESGRGVWSETRPGGPPQAAVFASSPDSARAISERVSGMP